MSALSASEKGLIVEPNRAYLTDLVESALIRNDTGITLCLAKLRQGPSAIGNPIDVMGVAKIAPGGVATVRGALQVMDVDKEPREHGIVTSCLRDQLGKPAFPGVDESSLSGHPHALVAFRLLDARER